ARGHVPRPDGCSAVRLPGSGVLRARRRPASAARGATVTRTLLLSLALLAVGTAGAAERILSFDSQIQVPRNDIADVVEAVEGREEGNQTRRGIFREFPTISSGPDGTRSAVGFDLVSIKRDGVNETFHTERRSNGVVIYIGHPDRLLSPGEY